MKNGPFFLATIAAVLGLLALSPRTSAQPAQQFWDGTQTTGDGTIHGGSGTWNLTTTNWTDVTGDKNHAYEPFTDVVFSGAAGTVTLGDTITTNDNAVAFRTNGYVINPNGFEIQMFTSFTVDPGVTATINAPLTNSPVGFIALTKLGAGTLILTAVNTYTGITTLNGGVLSISQDANLGTAPGTPVDQLVFNGGTLQATASFTLNPNRGVMLNAGAGFSGGTFDVTDGNVLTIAGAIAGSGNLTEVGSGTLILAGVNTYTGITAINGGALSISQDANLGTPPGTPVGNRLTLNGGMLQATASFTLNPNRGVTLSAGGTFDVTGANVLTIAGTIAGPGSLTKIGTGTLTLTGANTYTGGTNFNGGTLAANSDASLGTGALSFNGGTLEALAAGGGIASSKAITLSSGGGTFLADAGTASNLGGAITGTGAWTKTGPGTLTLSGTNTYSGATTVNAGILEAGSAGAFSPRSPFTINTGAVLDLNGLSNVVGSLAGSGLVSNSGGVGALSNATLSVGADNTSTTFSGTLQDGARTLALTKVGTGTLTLPGTNTYTGTTTVNNGSLIVDGSVASAQTLVNTNGLLGGRGSLGGSLVNSGIVSPGDSPGTFTVSGSYTQNANGALRIEVAGLAPTLHDLLAIGGHASLAGTLQLIPLGGFRLHVGDKVTFLTANGGVSGVFSTIQNEFPTTVKTQIVVLPTSVELEGIQGSFVPAACNPNTVAVAQALDSAASDPRAAGLINFLNNQPLSKLCSDFTLIAPEQLASIYNIGVSLANVQTANLLRRMDDIQAGSRGFSAAGFTLNGSTPNFSGGLSGPTGPEGKAGPSALAPIPENRWGVFATGVGEFTDVDSTGIARGYDLQTGGITLGVDYRVCPNFAIGLLAGYAHTNADLANNGDLDVNSGTFGVYATAFTGGFYLDTALTGGISGYDSHRTALLGTASGSTDGGELNVLVAGGYDWKKGDLTVGPTASFQYTYVSFGGFTESGSLAPLTFDDQHVDSIRTAFGAKASYDWKVSHVLVRPELRLAWQHEYGDSAYSIDANFANGAGNGFTVTSPKIGRDSLLIGAGAAVLLNDRISIYAYYDGEVARTNYESNNVSAGVRITF